MQFLSLFNAYQAFVKKLLSSFNRGPSHVQLRDAIPLQLVLM